MSTQCPKCSAENTEDSQFCKKCATPLEADVVHTKTLETPIEELKRGTVFAGRYEIIEELIELAEFEERVERIAEELGITNRKVNALENYVILIS